MSSPEWVDSPAVLINDPLVIPRRKLTFDEYVHLNSLPHHLQPRQIFMILLFLPLIILNLVRFVQRHVNGSNETTEEIENPYPTSSGMTFVVDFFGWFVRESANPRSRVASALSDLTSLAACLSLLVAADHYHIVPVAKRAYSRDLFIFLMLLLFAFAFAVPSKAFIARTSQSGLLNRDQTEEWKGWMQVAFVWYHYFAAGETYPLIRILIAAYVWQTGFGNFSFFWARGDFSFARVWKMNFRLNFLVACLCLAMPRPFMLYYICPLHTLWFLVTYVIMAILPQVHHTPIGAVAKLAIACVAVITLWPPGVPYPNASVADWGVSPYVPAIFDVVWTPLKPLLSFQGRGLYEWYFRTRLDCWIPMLGWVCAYFYPPVDAWLARNTGAIAHPPAPPKPAQPAAAGGAAAVEMVALASPTTAPSTTLGGPSDAVARKGSSSSGMGSTAASVVDAEAGAAQQAVAAAPTSSAVGISTQPAVPEKKSSMSTAEAAAITSPSTAQRWAVSAVLFTVGVAMMWWWTTAFWVPLAAKRSEYNSWHPYVSWLPVIGYILARNCCGWLRERYLFPLTWIGRITLETYLCQHHLYLANDAKTILVLVPEYPLVNFFVVTVVYVAVSHRLMNITLVRWFCYRTIIRCVPCWSPTGVLPCSPTRLYREPTSCLSPPTHACAALYLCCASSPHPHLRVSTPRLSRRRRSSRSPSASSPWWPYTCRARPCPSWPCTTLV